MRLDVIYLIILLCASFLGLQGCDEETTGTFTVKLGGEWFTLETAIDEETQKLGLGGRTEIADDGGMIFINNDDQKREFWMKDCLVNMDIIYVERGGFIDSIFTMKAVEPQQPNETLAQYELRLKKTASYPSRGKCRYIIELREGRANELGLERGQKLELDLKWLKRLAEQSDGP
jgi:uncharacterized membrane protein (UPF0127 family)